MMSSPTIISSLVLALLVLGLRGTEAASQSSQKIGNGYRLVSIQESPNGGLIGLLQVNQKTTTYGPDIHNLQLFVKQETGGRLRVHITDADKQRWEVPYNLLQRDEPPKFKQTIGGSGKKPIKDLEYAGSDLIFSFVENPFGFSVRRKTDGQTLFNTSSDGSAPFSNLVFKDQYLEISTLLPKAASLYGLGENSQPHGIKLYPNDPYTLFTTDISAINLNVDLYGSHPMYMDLRNDNDKASAHGVLLLNSNGMDVFYRGTSLTYKIIGGVLDFYFFPGRSPLDVVDQYTAFIGRPAPMPYWSFGFHQCRWGYPNLTVVESVVENYRKAEIPLDVIWNDDDHMDRHRDFTLNAKNYTRSKLLAFLDKIHRRGMKYVVINDPGIAVDKSYGVYQRAVAADVFIKYEGKPYLAQVWPGPVNFPDFLNPATVSWWGDEIRRFHELAPIDGLWIDMNEASNFCSGRCSIPPGTQCPNGTGPGWVCCLDCRNITKTRWDDPPYKINASGMQAPIGFKTIATSAVHYNGVKDYDAHSLYGFSESIATHKALQGLQGKRPFILARSTFVGSGRYVAHWTGDNKGTWDDLKISISTILNFGIFGVSMVGADICGFYPAPTEELCNRWIEVGAFYPFSRDHANFYSPPQELYRWDSVARSARNALGMRYKLLPYLYTLNYRATISGSPIARPLFFSFPELTECYGLSTQFMLGSGLMVSPVLEEGKTNVKAFFPAGTWYSLFNMSRAIDSKTAHYVTLETPLHAVNVHLYQNMILPMQRGGLVSRDVRMTPFSLVVPFPAASGGEPKGELFVDNDELPEMKLGNGQSSYVEFYAMADEKSVRVWSRVQEGGFALEKGWVVERIVVLGLSDGSRASFMAEIDGHPVEDVAGVEFVVSEQEVVSRLEDDGGKKTVVVEIHKLKLPLGKDFSLNWKLGSQ